MQCRVEPSSEIIGVFIMHARVRSVGGSDTDVYFLMLFLSRARFPR